jgi:hypothetical protein
MTTLGLYAGTASRRPVELWKPLGRTLAPES